MTLRFKIQGEIADCRKALETLYQPASFYDDLRKRIQTLSEVLDWMIELEKEDPFTQGWGDGFCDEQDANKNPYKAAYEEYERGFEQGQQDW